MKDLPDLKLPDVGEAAVAIEEEPRPRVGRITCTLSYMPQYGSCTATMMYAQRHDSRLAAVRRMQDLQGQQGNPLGQIQGFGGLGIGASFLTPSPLMWRRP